MGNQIKATLADPDGAGTQTSPVLEYGYDAAGNMEWSEDALDNRTLRMVLRECPVIREKALIECPSGLSALMFTYCSTLIIALLPDISD